MIVPVKDGYKIRSHKTGKLYPKIYPSREAAQRRIDQMERFKHINKSDPYAYIIVEKAVPVKGFMRVRRGKEEYVKPFQREGKPARLVEKKTIEIGSSKGESEPVIIYGGKVINEGKGEAREVFKRKYGKDPKKGESIKKEKVERKEEEVKEIEREPSPEAKAKFRERRKEIEEEMVTKKEEFFGKKFKVPKEFRSYKIGKVIEVRGKKLKITAIGERGFTARDEKGGKHQVLWRSIKGFGEEEEKAEKPEERKRSKEERKKLIMETRKRFQELLRDYPEFKKPSKKAVVIDLLHKIGRALFEKSMYGDPHSYVIIEKTFRLAHSPKRGEEEKIRAKKERKRTGEYTPRQERFMERARERAESY